MSLLPLVTLFNDSGERPWHLWLPALAQVTQMGRVLRGDAFSAPELLLPLAVAAAGTAICLGIVARRLRAAATR